MTAMFTGFPDDAVRFLGDLRKHNDRAWFQKNRARYDEALVAPARAFVDALGERLGASVPGLRVDGHGAGLDDGDGRAYRLEGKDDDAQHDDDGGEDQAEPQH